MPLPHTEAVRQAVEQLNGTAVSSDLLLAAFQLECHSNSLDSRSTGATVATADLTVRTLHFLITQVRFAAATDDAKVREILAVPVHSPYGHPTTLNDDWLSAISRMWVVRGKEAVQDARRRALATFCMSPKPAADGGTMGTELIAQAIVQTGKGAAIEVVDDAGEPSTTLDYRVALQDHVPEGVVWFPPTTQHSAPTPLTLSGDELYRLFCAIDAAQQAVDRISGHTASAPT